MSKSCIGTVKLVRYKITESGPGPTLRASVQDCNSLNEKLNIILLEPVVGITYLPP